MSSELELVYEASNEVAMERNPHPREMGVAFSVLAESFQHLSATVEKISDPELLGEAALNIEFRERYTGI